MRALRPLAILLLLSCFPSGAALAGADDRVAIIGAGAAGLTAAHTLLEKGYTQVTVYEREERVGGKVHSVDFEGVRYEVGAFWAGVDNPTVDRLATFYDVPFPPEETLFYVRDADGDELGLEAFVGKRYSKLQLIAGYYRWKRVQRKFSALDQPGGYFLLDHPDLYLPFEEFIDKYRIEVFADGFRPFWIGCGYGYYETTPSIYVLKLMFNSARYKLPELMREIRSDSPATEPRLRRSPLGYQAIWDRAAQRVPDLRLGQEVERVERVATGEGTEIRVTAAGVTDAYDKLIVATDLGAALRYLDASAEEQALFSQVTNDNYYIHLVRAELPHTVATMVFLDEYGAADTIGHLTAAVNRTAAPDVWTTGQLMPWDSTPEDAVALLRADFADLGDDDVEVLLQFQWTYFPHVDAAALADGFYPRLRALQGQQDTWYVGAITNFETVEGASSYAALLVGEAF